MVTIPTVTHVVVARLLARVLMVVVIAGLIHIVMCVRGALVHPFTEVTHAAYFHSAIVAVVVMGVLLVLWCMEDRRVVRFQTVVYVVNFCYACV